MKPKPKPRAKRKSQVVPTPLTDALRTIRRNCAGARVCRDLTKTIKEVAALETEITTLRARLAVWESNIKDA